MSNKITMATIPVEELITRCNTSSQETLQLLREVLEKLEDPTTQKAARHTLEQICAHAEHLLHLSYLEHPILGPEGESLSLRLIVFPSVFSPEEWSMTFYEGLARFPRSEFYARSIVELGTGCGWISLAVALRWKPARVFGVDINPRAILCSKLNLYLNALSEDGTPAFDNERLTLLDRVTFAESDLLDYFFEHPTTIDRIIGCIPQVLSPELGVMQKLASGVTSDEFLYSLSNYCEKQGYLEDEFGLGLIAKAIEQAIELLRPTGKVVLNLGGRPGEAVLTHMLRRRGFNVSKIWQARVKQTDDTDINQLVDIERASRHRFEFYVTERSETSISASTAYQYLNKGAPIYHAVSVYEGSLSYPSWLKRIFTVLKKEQFKDVRSALDLSDIDPEIAEERYSFLANICEKIDTIECFPYGETEGGELLRTRITKYLHIYHNLTLDKDDVLVSTSREALFGNLFEIMAPGCALVETRLRGKLPFGLLEDDSIIEAPRNQPITCLLMERLRPAVVITALEDHEIKSPVAFEALLRTAQEVGSFLVIDLSDQFKLSSQPPYYGFFDYLSNHAFPSNVMFVVDLIKNKVYPQLSLCISFAKTAQLRQLLIRAAELSYSRVPLMAQYLYEQLLEDLIFFKEPALSSKDLASHEHHDSHEKSVDSIEWRADIHPKVDEAFSHPAITGNELPFNKESIRLDYGENYLNAPLYLKKVVLESFVMRDIALDAANPEPVIRILLQKRFGLAESRIGELFFGSGVASLFSSILRYARNQEMTMLFPEGAYGYFRAALDYYKVSLGIIPGNAEDGFKFGPTELRMALNNQPTPSIVYLNAPISNPTGIVYTSAELRSLIEVAWEYKSIVLIDAVFAGLEFSISEVDLSWMYRIKPESRGQLALLGGISKEFAGAGLRFAYLYWSGDSTPTELRRSITKDVHYTTLHSMQRLFEAQVGGEPALVEHLELQRKELHSRALLLERVLTEQGWSVITPQGGLFLVARPTAWLGQEVEINEGGHSRTIRIDGDTIAELLFVRENLAINNATWTGLKDYCRFVLSVDRAVLDEAIQRLDRFGEFMRGIKYQIHRAIPHKALLLSWHLNSK